MRLSHFLRVSYLLLEVVCGNVELFLDVVSGNVELFLIDKKIENR